MKQIKILFAFILFLLLVTQTACSDNNDLSLESEMAFPTPETGKAVISGKIINAITNEPAAGNPFLARNLTADNPELPPTISFSMQNDPGAFYDIDTGNFYFENVEPADNYVILLIYGPGDTEVIKEPNSQTPMIISVNENELIDLGVLEIQE